MEKKNSTDSDVITCRRELLKCLETLVHCERQLTAAVTKALPLVPSENMEYKVATPQNMSQVVEILAYARSLATRTSAPCGWNPTLPLIGFSTPNPLPHQIRGGCLGVMQLQQVKQEQSLAAIPPQTITTALRTHVEQSKTEGATTDDSEVARLKVQRKERALRAAADEERRRKKTREADRQQKQITMNLSESSSSSSEDSDEE